MKQKHVDCILCTGSNPRPIMRKEGHTLVRCNICGLVFINPRIAQVDEVYKENTVHTEYYRQTARCDKLEFLGRLRLFRKYSSTGRILDIGCATGTFMKLAQKAGWDAYGVDLNARSIEECKKAGLKVKFGFMNKKSFPKEFFDFIHMSDVIEHMENPLEMLRLCATFLKPGGHIYITTPNFASRWARKFQIKPTDHLYYFTKKTFTQMVRQAGLEPIACKPLNRLRDLKALKYSISIERSLLSRLFFFAMNLIPIRSLCTRLPLNDDLLLVARKPKKF